MANRHKFMKGGRAGRASGGRNIYSGAGSNVAKEAEGHGEGFKHGGRHHVGKAHGGPAKHRLDKRARGGGVGHSPFSSAHREEDKHRTPHTKDHSMPRKHGGRTSAHNAKHAHNFGAHHGAGHEEPHEHHLPVHHKHGGHVKRAHGGKVKHDDDDGDEEEEEAGPCMAKGGGIAKHMDIYITKGGDHHWKDEAAKRGGTMSAVGASHRKKR